MQVVKSGLPQHTRPTEPENETDVSDCVARLAKNDPTLKEVNINNMKAPPFPLPASTPCPMEAWTLQRTPIPEIQKLIYSLKENTFCRKLSMANIGLTDTGAEVRLPLSRLSCSEGCLFQPLLEVLRENETLVHLNLETNYLSGEFLVKLFEALLETQTLMELKLYNQASPLPPCAPSSIPGRRCRA